MSDDMAPKIPSKPKSPPKDVIAFRLSRELIARIRAAAENNGVPINRVAEWAFERVLGK